MGFGMKRIVILGLLCLPMVVQAQVLPSASSAVSALELANSYFSALYPNPGAPVTTSGTVRPSNYWFRAVYFEGLMGLYGVDPKPNFLSYGVAWGAANKWGLVGGNSDRNANDQCAGQTYIDLYKLNPTPSYLQNIQTDLNNILASSAPVTDWWWIDAVHMAMPVWAKMGVLTGNTNYFNEMYKFYANTRVTQGKAGLFNAVDGLWWRDSTFVNPPYKEPNGKSCYWSRGNGWVYSALVRTLDILPPSDPHFSLYLSDFQAMSQALLQVQRSDGFWNVSLFDSTDFGGPETSGTALFVYGMAWGVRKGYLPAATYESAAILGWNAMVSEALHPNGFLGYCQGSGDQPSSGQPISYNSVPNFQDIGTGCFLLAGSEMVRLIQSVNPASTPTKTPTLFSTPTPFLTATHTNTPVQLTATFTRTNTPIPPTATNTLVSPTSTPTATRTLTPLPPTSTFTVTPTFTLTQVAGLVVIQAENNCGFAGTIDNNHSGFTGTGFVNLSNNNMAGITFSLDSTMAQNLSITFRYSDGTATARPMLLTRISPAASTPVSVIFGVTANWDTWATITAAVPLVAGNNLISLVPTAANINGGPNLDEFTFTSNTVSAGNCGGTASAMVLSGGANSSQATTSHVVVAPNVSRNGSPIQFQVTLGRPAEIQLSLSAVAGEKVCQTELQGNIGRNNFNWSPEDQSGSAVAGGLYLYLIQIQDETILDRFTGKVMVVH